MKNFTFLSLGGLQEIGLNCYLYGYTKTGITNYIMVDIGIGFRDTKFNFLDTFFPDISVLKQKDNYLKAILLTHAHEDHIGAIGYHYKDIVNVPIYTASFTAQVVRNKLKHYNITDPHIIEIKFGHRYSIGDFFITFIPINHSIPESSMIIIEYDETVVLHSGDFNINPNTFNPRDILQFLPKKVDYLFCDSTNANKNRTYQPEEIILPTLSNIIKNAKKSVWTTLFSSNIERLNNLINVAKKYNRKCILLGTSVYNYYNIAKNLGYIITDNVISLDELNNYNKNELLYIITGSQGEPNSFLQRVLLTDYKGLSIDSGDSVIFLSKPIPGNEVKVNNIYNLIALRGASLYTHEDCVLHVSGHAYRDQLEKLITVIDPYFVVPIHGEELHTRALVSIAKNLNCNTRLIKNGEIVKLSKGEINTINFLPVNKLFYEGGRNLSLLDTPLLERKKVMYEGVVNASLYIKRNKINKDIRIATVGLLKPEEKSTYLKSLIKKILSLNIEVSKNEINNVALLQSKIKSMIKKFFKTTLGKKPIINIEIFYV